MQRIHPPILRFLQNTLIFLALFQLPHSAVWLLLSTSEDWELPSSFSSFWLGRHQQPPQKGFFSFKTGIEFLDPKI